YREPAMTNKYETVSFLSDYGTRDEFVGVVKSVIYEIAPQSRIVDLTHEIEPFDVRAGSLSLARSVSYIASGVVLAVVDPGVGSSRRAVAVEVLDGKGVFVGPDNGLLAMAIALAGGAGRAVCLTNTKYHLASPGETFAGRDIFGPVAAHLCNGVDLSELGEMIDPALLLPGVVPIPREEKGALHGEVTWVDRFGNCQLNIGPDEVASMGEVLRVEIGSVLSGASVSREQVVRSLKIVRSYDAIGSGLGLVVDSYGMLSICVDRGSAARELSIGQGDLIILSRLTETEQTKPIPTPVKIAPKR
ncbi:MAG: SAM-dependent chlorinase/fluorinase, partial [Actinomycetota bacterium]|nr:SAM-dependent chlorinase/fluorinase [Actinomycetota bacterium]